MFAGAVLLPGHVNKTVESTFNEAALVWLYHCTIDHSFHCLSSSNRDMVILM